MDKRFKEIRDKLSSQEFDYLVSKIEEMIINNKTICIIQSDDCTGKEGIPICEKCIMEIAKEIQEELLNKLQEQINSITQVKTNEGMLLSKEDIITLIKKIKGGTKNES